MLKSATLFLIALSLILGIGYVRAEEESKAEFLSNYHLQLINEDNPKILQVVLGLRWIERGFREYVDLARQHSPSVPYEAIEKIYDADRKDPPFNLEEKDAPNFSDEDVKKYSKEFYEALKKYAVEHLDHKDAPLMFYYEIDPCRNKGNSCPEIHLFSHWDHKSRSRALSLWTRLSRNETELESLPAGGNEAGPGDHYPAISTWINDPILHPYFGVYETHDWFVAGTLQAWRKAPCLGTDEGVIPRAEGTQWYRLRNEGPGFADIFYRVYERLYGLREPGWDFAYKTDFGSRQVIKTNQDKVDVWSAGVKLESKELS